MSSAGEPPGISRRADHHPSLVSSSQAARAVGISVAALVRATYHGRLVPVTRTAGGHSRWDVEDLRRQLLASDDRGRAGT